MGYNDLVSGETTKAIKGILGLPLNYKTTKAKCGILITDNKAKKNSNCVEYDKVLHRP